MCEAARNSCNTIGLIKCFSAKGLVSTRKKNDQCTQCWLPPTPPKTHPWDQGIFLLFPVLISFFSFCSQMEGICPDVSCERKSKQMYKMMDLSENPCEDFYQYACGRWLSTHTIPSTRGSWTIDSEIIKDRDKNLKKLLQSSIRNNDVDSAERKMKLLYRKCMDLQEDNGNSIQPLRSIVRRLGGWAIDSEYTFTYLSFCSYRCTTKVENTVELDLSEQELFLLPAANCFDGNTFTVGFNPQRTVVFWRILYVQSVH